jgi:hypothetical protein
MFADGRGETNGSVDLRWFGFAHHEFAIGRQKTEWRQQTLEGKHKTWHGGKRKMPEGRCWDFRGELDQQCISTSKRVMWILPEFLQVQLLSLHCEL